MRIGILTFHNANNYGAVLQAYCLQETLRRIGFDVEIVDYRNPLIESRMHPFSFSEFLYHPFLFVFRVLRFSHLINIVPLILINLEQNFLFCQSDIQQSI